MLDLEEGRLCWFSVATAVTPILFPQELLGRKASGAGAAEFAKAEEKS